MNSQDYFEMAAEYRKSAEDLSKTIKKYKKQLKYDGSANLELINSKKFRLELMKENALHTAFELERKANKILAAEKKDTLT